MDSIGTEVQSIIEECKRLFPKSDIDVAYRSTFSESKLKKDTKSFDVDDSELPGEISLSNPRKIPPVITMSYIPDNIFIQFPSGYMEIDLQTKKYDIVAENVEGLVAYLTKLGYHPQKDEQ